MDHVKELWNEYKHFSPAVFFISGFVLDIFTLGHVDDVVNIVQQFLYLLAIGLLLVLQFLDESGALTVSERWSKVWKYRREAIHFLLGSLLSIYTIFFFISSSFVVSFIFMIFLAALLIANELPQFQEQGVKIKFGLFALCVLSFFSCLIPTLLGFIGYVPLILTLLATLVVIQLIAWYLQKKPTIEEEEIKRNVRNPAWAVLGVFLCMYILRIIPPIPLSIQHIGVYHTLEKEEGLFKLGYDRPDWKIWKSDSSDFVAREGDKVYCFARVFAPRKFEDKIFFHWFFDDPKQGWVQADRVPMQVLGGRRAGFRGYAVKTNHQPGDWKVKVMTSDGREIGRISFSISGSEQEVAKNERVLRYDYH